MKTKVIILSVILSVASFSFCAKSENLKHQIEKDQEGRTSSIISIDAKTSNFVMKNVYTYDSKGNRKTKTLYIWNKNANCWEERSTTECFYDINNNLAMTSFSKWDRKTGSWSKKSKNMIYNYNEKGKFLSIDHVKSERINNTYLTQK